MRRILQLTAVMPWLGIAASAWAQQAAPAAGHGGTLEEVVVTAQKRPSNLQKTAATISVISGTTIRNTATTNLSDIIEQVPGVSLTGGTTNPLQIFIRGVGSQDPNNSPQVSAILDGIPAIAGVTGATGTAGTSANQAGSTLTANYDISQVEVLAGPQGTLYGGDTAGGALVINTNDPVFRTTGSASFTVGNYNLIEATAVANVPLSDVLAARVALFSATHDGYYTNGLGDENTQAGRLKLRYKAGAADFVVTGEYTKTGGHGDGEADVNGGLQSNPWTSLQDSNQRESSKTFQLRAKLNWDLGWSVLTALPNYIHEDSSENLAGHGLPTIASTTTESESFEARLAAPANARLFWQTGFYLLSGSVPHSTNLAASDVGNYAENISVKSDTASYAAFGTATYSLLDKLRITGGLRWQVDSTNGIGEGFRGTSPSTLVEEYELYPRRSWRNLSWKAGIAYDLTPASMIYASAATGYAPGTVQAIQFPSINGGPTIPAFVNSTASQVLTQYAAGSKNRFLGNRLEFNIEAYVTQYATYNEPRPQTTIIPGMPPTVYLSGLTTAQLSGGAHNDGFDLSSHYLLTPDDRLGLAIAGNWSSFGNEPKYPSFNQKPFLYAPVWKYSPSYQHIFPLANGGSVTFMADVQYQTSQYVATDYTPAERDPAYTRINLSLAYNSPDQKWNVTGFVKNLENHASMSDWAAANLLLNGVLTAVDQANLSPPRTYGATVSAQF